MVIYCSVSVCSSKENGLPPISDEVYCYYQNLSFLEERIGCHKFKEAGKFGPLFHWMQAYREMLPKQITESPSDRGSPTLQTMAEKQGSSQITYIDSLVHLLPKKDYDRWLQHFNDKIFRVYNTYLYRKVVIKTCLVFLGTFPEW